MKKRVLWLSSNAAKPEVQFLGLEVFGEGQDRGAFSGARRESLRSPTRVGVSASSWAALCGGHRAVGVPKHPPSLGSALGRRPVAGCHHPLTSNQMTSPCDAETSTRSLRWGEKAWRKVSAPRKENGRREALCRSWRLGTAQRRVMATRLEPPGSDTAALEPAPLTSAPLPPSPPFVREMFSVIRY